MTKIVAIAGTAEEAFQEMIPVAEMISFLEMREIAIWLNWQNTIPGGDGNNNINGGGGNDRLLGQDGSDRMYRLYEE